MKDHSIPWQEEKRRKRRFCYPIRRKARKGGSWDQNWKKINWWLYWRVSYFGNFWMNLPISNEKKRKSVDFSLEYWQQGPEKCPFDQNSIQKSLLSWKENCPRTTTGMKGISIQSYGRWLVVEAIITILVEEDKDANCWGIEPETNRYIICISSLESLFNAKKSPFQGGSFQTRNRKGDCKGERGGGGNSSTDIVVVTSVVEPINS